MAKELEAKLNISGELDASLKSAIQAAADRMEQMSEAADKAEGATAALNNMIKQQEKTLKAATAQYQSYILSGEQSTKEAQDLASGIMALSDDLARNKDALNAAEQAAKSLATDYRSLDGSAGDAKGGISDLGSAAKETEGGFTILKGAAANLVADGFQFIVSGAGQAVSALMSLSDETRELRQDLASLDTAYQQQNFSAEQANDTARSLYGIFGESDRAIEAANNIARVAESQEDLENWTRISAGVWADFQDALPVENISEAASETLRTGTAVSGLSDALNWNSEAAEMFADYMGGDVVTAEDAFNKALSECSTEQERQQLIMDTLTALYGEAGDQYGQTAGSLIEANKAAWDAAEAQANLGEIMEPVTTKATELKTEFMNDLAPSLQTVADKAADALTWLQQHPGVMQAMITGAGILGGLLVVMAGALTAVGIASVIASAGLLPVAGAILAILAVIGVVTFAIMNFGNILDWAKGKASDAAASIQQKWQELKTNAINTWEGMKTDLQNKWTEIKDKAAAFADGVVDKVSSSWSGLTSILTAPFDGLLGLIDTASNKLGALISKAKNSRIASYLPHFASGGFTAGPSIAGEAGTEAVISFDPRYRAENLRYWSAAGQMLGADDVSPLSVEPRGATSNTNVIENVTFAPKITITGNAEKKDIIAAIRETYPEFMDLIDEVLADRGVGAYGY